MIQLCLNWTASKNAIAAGKQTAKSNLLRKRGLLAHTSAAFLKNCCTEKLFRLCNVSFKTMQELFLEKPSESDSAESLRYLPVCCSPVIALSKLLFNLS